NLVDDVHAGNHTTEHGVARIEVWLRRVRDEPLTAAGVRPGIERHADGAAQIRTLVQLVADRIAGTAFTVAAWIAVLNHEVGNDAVDAQAVEKSLARQTDEVLRRERRVEDRERDLNRALVGIHVYLRRHRR